MNDITILKRQLHPRQEANVISILTYFWTIPTFFKGLKKDLEVEDLFNPLEDHASSTLGDKLEEAWRRDLKFHKNPSLWRALGRVFGLELILFGFVFVFIELVLKMSQPLALSQLLSFYTKTDTSMNKSAAFVYASIIIGSSLGNTLLAHWYSVSLQHFGMKVRIACCSLIYRKSLSLSKNAIGETTIGQMVNLLSNDVNRFDKAAVHFHSLWFVPIETGIVVYFLYRLVGLTSAVGVLFLALFVPLQVYLGKKIANLRLKTALKTDVRIQIMNEIISGIQVIKMYTWEKQFTKLIGLARKLEIDKIRGASYVKGIMLSFSVFTTRIAIFLIVLVYVLLGNTLTAEYVFVATSFYNILRQAITRYYPQGIAQLGEASVSISRLQKFLLYEETKAQTVESLNIKLGNEINGNLGKNSETDTALNNNKGVKVSLQNVSAKWSSNSPNKTLENINVAIQAGELVAITGPVGSGKTSFLHVILKELPLEKGTVTVNGKISYASQEPWLFGGTVKQNILFGQPLNLKRYQKVLEVCALDQDLSLFPFGDESLVGERGVKLSGGQRARVSLARVIYRDVDIYLLDDPLSAVDAHVGKKLFEDCIMEFLKTKCTILVTHQLQYLQNLNRIVVIENGHITTCGTYQELNQMGIDFTNHQNQDKISEILDDVESKNEKLKENVTKQNGIQIEVKEHRSSGKIASDVYSSYFRAGGSLLVAFLVLFLFLLTQFCASGADYFVAYWINLENRRSEEKRISRLEQNTCIYIYLAIVILLIILTLARTLFFFKYCMEASTRLHNDMFSNIIQVAMNFFNTNSSGRILNRFSKDVGSVDETLPSVIIDCMQIGLTVVGVTVVVAVINPWLLIVTGIIFTIFYALKVVYLATSRSVKRLEGITRSPVFTHMNATLQGLTTIRAFGAQKALQKEFDAHQDLHSSAWYLFLSCSTAFGFWLDMICVIYIGIVTFSFLVVKNEQYAANVGLAITQAINLTGMFQWGMRQWSDLENQMTSVERVTEYTKVQQEPRRLEVIPPSNWPENGNINFFSVSLRYSPTDPYVLEQLNIGMKSKEKIGIVGRTGAGKSSLIYALFQLTQTEGAILIDNIDITKIPLPTLRSKISIIPQEPVLFSGTLRKNLDPFDEYTDIELWNALEEVELKNAILALPSGLDEKISEGGSNFSVGQRQLICLARAIMRNNKILVLDEATANLDNQTDALIQKTIKKKFAECTVLTIAHRLHTIMDSDKVLVMDSGNAVEFDSPHLLLTNKKSLFYAMVQQSRNSSTYNQATS